MTKMIMLTLSVMFLGLAARAEGKKILNCSTELVNNKVDGYVEITQTATGASIEAGDGDRPTGYYQTTNKAAVANIAAGIADNLIGTTSASKKLSDGKSYENAIFFRATGKGLENGFLAIHGNVYRLSCSRLE